MSDFSPYYGKGWANLSQNIIFPEKLVQGDQWCFQYYAGDWGNSGYAASITFAASTTKLTSAAALNQGWYQWQVPGSATSQLPPQPYAYNVNVTLGSQRLTLERGAVIVVPDISVSGTNVTSQTNLQLMLSALDQTLITLMGQKTSMVQFAGQMYQMQDIDKLFVVREKLATQVSDEMEKLRGNQRSRRIVTYFRNM